MADDDALWMPLYIGDYLKDTMKLTAEQHGVYLLLLMAMWQEGGTLANDDEELASTCKLTPIAWKKHRPTMMKYFQIDGDVLIQKRLTTEFQKAERIIKANRENGKKGGRPKKYNPDKTQTLTQIETQTKPTGLDSVSESGGFSKPKPNPNPNPDETQSQSQSQTTPPSSSVGNDDVITPYPGAIAVVAWNLADDVVLDLEISHGIPVEFSLSVLDEFRDFWAGKAVLLPTEWQSRFRQRVRDQWDRTNKLRSAS